MGLKGNFRNDKNGSVYTNCYLRLNSVNIVKNEEIKGVFMIYRDHKSYTDELNPVSSISICVNFSDDDYEFFNESVLKEEGKSLESQLYKILKKDETFHSMTDC